MTENPFLSSQEKERLEKALEQDSKARSKPSQTPEEKTPPPPDLRHGLPKRRKDIKS